MEFALYFKTTKYDEHVLLSVIIISSKLMGAEQN